MYRMLFFFSALDCSLEAVVPFTLYLLYYLRVLEFFFFGSNAFSEWMVSKGPVLATLQTSVTPLPGGMA